MATSGGHVPKECPVTCCAREALDECDVEGIRDPRMRAQFVSEALFKVNSRQFNDAARQVNRIFEHSYYGVSSLTEAQIKAFDELDKAAERLKAAEREYKFAKDAHKAASRRAANLMPNLTPKFQPDDDSED